MYTSTVKTKRFARLGAYTNEEKYLCCFLDKTNSYGRYSLRCSSVTERPSSIISANGGSEPISNQDPFLQILSSPFHLHAPAPPLHRQNSEAPRFKSSLTHLHLQAEDPSRCQQQGQERIQEDCAVGRGTAAGGGRW